MRRIAATVLAIVGVSVAAIALTAILDHTPKAFTLGVPAEAGVAPLDPGHVICQQPIDVAAGAEFDAIRAQIGTYGKPGSALVVTVRDSANRVLARGRQAGGYGDVAVLPTHRIALDRMVRAPRVDVCLRNVGTRRVAFYGTGDLAARGSSAFLDGKPLAVDLSLSFERSPRSLASLVPLMFERASLFRFPWVGPWLYWLLGAVLLFGTPTLLILALRAAVERDAS
jgi:hypothetical protein